MILPRSLGFRLLIWFVVLGIGPALVMALVAYSEVLETDESTALSRLSMAARTRAGEIRGRLNEYRSHTVLLAQHDRERTADVLDRPGIVRGRDGRYAFVGPDGTVRGPAAPERLTQDQMAAVRAGRALLVGDEMLVGTSLRDGGATVAWFPAARVYALLEAELGLGRTGDTFLVDGSGRVLAGHRPEERADSVGRRVDLPPEPGSYEDRRGVRMLVAWVPLEGWRVAAEMERAEVVGPLHGLAGRLLGIGAVAFLLVMGALLYAGRRIDRSVGAMVDSLERAARGEFGEEVRVPELPATRKVVDAINDMHRRLAERDAEISGQRQQLFCQRCELERLNAEILEADRMKSEFVANMSHEVRTPLHSILSLSSVLMAATSGPLNEEQRKQVEMIERNGRALLAMLGDILDFSKIESGRMTVLLDDVPPGAAVAGVREAVAPLARDKGLELTLECAADLPAVRTDPEKLHRVLLNLAHNAVKFTEQGSITLRCGPGDGGGAVFSVTDTGPGIPREQLADVFEPFRQVDGSTTRAAGGTGLGLTIAKSLVERLGGRIGVASKPGQGTTFTVVLPPAAPTPAIADAPRGVGAVGNDVIVVGATAPGDDVIREELQAAGFRVARAVCGRDLLQVLSRDGVGAILIDVSVLLGEGLDVPGAVAARLGGNEFAVFGYWLDPGRREGGTLGELGLHSEADGGCRVECGGVAPLRIPAQPGPGEREAVADWVRAVSARGAVPLHEVIRGIVRGIDPALRRPRAESRLSGEALVFVVDPDPDARYSMTLQMERMGYTVHSGATPDEMPEGTRPGAVVTELRIPGVPDPVGVLRERTGAPVIVLTADARPETQQAALSAGATSVLVKPARDGALSRALESALREVRA